jgi:hypothetical protein
VDAPEPPLILVAFSVQERLVELVVTVRLTVSLKRFTLRGATVIVELPALLTFTPTLDGLALMVKSWKLKTPWLVWVSVPLVPVTMRM